METKFKDIIIAHDMTKKERQQCKALVEEAKFKKKIKMRRGTGSFVSGAPGTNDGCKVTCHHAALAYFRSKSTLALLKPGDTRFATNFIMLHRLLECKDAFNQSINQSIGY